MGIGSEQWNTVYIIAQTKNNTENMIAMKFLVLCQVYKQDGCGKPEAMLSALQRVK